MLTPVPTAAATATIVKKPFKILVRQLRNTVAVSLL
jgi:hypothetical protein